MKDRALGGFRVLDLRASVRGPGHATLCCWPGLGAEGFIRIDDPTQRRHPERLRGASLLWGVEAVSLANARESGPTIGLHYLKPRPLQGKAITTGYEEGPQGAISFSAVRARRRRRGDFRSGCDAAARSETLPNINGAPNPRHFVTLAPLSGATAPNGRSRRREELPT